MDTPQSHFTPFLILAATPVGNTTLEDPSHHRKTGANTRCPHYLRSDGRMVYVFHLREDDRVNEWLTTDEAGQEVLLGVTAYRSEVLPSLVGDETWEHPDTFIPGVMKTLCLYPLYKDYVREELPPTADAKKTCPSGITDLEILQSRALSSRKTTHDRRKFLSMVAEIGRHQAAGEIVDTVAIAAIGRAAQDIGMDATILLNVYDEGKRHPKKYTSAERDASMIRAWDRGDHQELGDDLVRRLCGPTPGDPQATYTQSLFWTFDRNTGGWVSHRKSSIMVKIGEYAGTWVKTGEETTQKLKLTQPMKDGIRKVAEDALDDVTFFDDAPPGLALPDPKQQPGEPGGLFLPIVDGKFSPPLFLSSEHRVMQDTILPVHYSPKADCPRFIQFLSEVFAGLPDEEIESRVSTIMEFIGACLLGVAPQYQQALLLVGSGANGKSTLLNALSNLFPQSSRTAIPLQAWGEDYKRAMLSRARVNICNELPSRDVLDSDSVKAIITGEEVTARDPYRPAFTFRPRAGHIFACNKLPPVTDLSDGFFRRFIIVDFPNQFKGANADLNLESTLREELPGILALVLWYAEQLTARGRYLTLASSEKAKQEWRTHNDNVTQWVADACAIGGTTWTRGSEAYDAYKQWATRFGFKPCSIKEFNPRLSGIGVGRKVPGNVPHWNLRVTSYVSHETVQVDV